MTAVFIRETPSKLRASVCVSETAEMNAADRGAADSRAAEPRARLIILGHHRALPPATKRHRCRQACADAGER